MSANRAGKRLGGIPFEEFGGTGCNLVFLHANSYPPRCYEPLLHRLASGYRTTAILQRPLWPDSDPEWLESWHPMSSDFLRFLREQRMQDAIAVGHSMGATVALRAALQAPDALAALVLLDPVIVGRGAMLLWQLFRGIGAGHELHRKIRGASHRRTVFASRQQAFRTFRKYTVFRLIRDPELRIMIRGLTQRSRDGGYHLRYRPDWEARIYYTAIWNDGDLWRDLPRLRVPTFIIRGARSDTLSPGTCTALQDANRHISIRTLDDATHLMPLERPVEVHGLMRSFLSLEKRASRNSSRVDRAARRNRRPFIREGGPL